MAILNIENRFLFIVYSDLHLIVGIDEAKLGKMLSLAKLGKMSSLAKPVE